jgi:hypothetical protein
MVKTAYGSNSSTFFDYFSVIALRIFNPLHIFNPPTAPII